MELTNTRQLMIVFRRLKTLAFKPFYFSTKRLLVRAGHFDKTEKRKLERETFSHPKKEKTKLLKVRWRSLNHTLNTKRKKLDAKYSIRVAKREK